MQLPNSAQAYVQPRKLTGYLLSKTHAVGKAKAKFSRELGFNETNLIDLEEALLNLAKTQAVYEIIETVHGLKYVIIGSINTPLGKSVTILSVWIVDTGENTPRFVTACPYKLS